jgi:hypothetical protein
MASDGTTPRSRRALLAAAAGAAGALAAQAALPLAAAAAPANLQTESDNPTTAQTSVTQGAGGSISFKGRTVNTDFAAIVGSTGDEVDMSTDTGFTGVFGYASGDEVDFLGSGVWGQSPDTGVVGTGDTGVLGLGTVGVWAQGFGGPGMVADSFDSTQPAVLARGSSSSDPALQVSGKVKFSRSGRQSVSSGKSSYAKSLAGMTTSSKVFAVLATSESGRYIRAVVPATGKFTVYFNTALSSSAVFSWFVLD